MKMLARGYAYWMNINRDIEETVRHCRSCQEATKMPVKTVLNSWAVETKPWERIHIDYARPLNGKMYLVVVDAYSKWPEISVMSSSSTAATLRKLRMLFARYGNPRVIVPDNGPQFTATEFQQFRTKQGIEHVRSPPFHPQSNGQTERFVDILKRTLQKIKKRGTTEKLAEFLQCYRRTPGTSVPGSPSLAENS
ncbi:integrase core domain protein [Oesophagostomum dentatum]|uniref:Integrase core domain protein n=1 Tax=Oesophagostomum dentatum TaxID=61180 RepID=A0A0B1TMV8_OESDE|nr:integrase core domain protein [Oesophagostomum dentatum]